MKMNESYAVISSKGEGKGIPVLILTEHHAMKAYWGVEL
jgi:hypothetical protein